MQVMKDAWKERFDPKFRKDVNLPDNRAPWERPVEPPKPPNPKAGAVEQGYSQMRENVKLRNRLLNEKR
jgi:hypothetical protein